MATQAAAFIKDENLNVHFDVTSGLKSTKPQKGGRLGGRKVLGDISNSSRRPSTTQPPNKLSSKNAISIEEDFATANKKTSIAAKTKVSSRGSGRKVLGDLTNSVLKPRGVVQEAKKVQDKKLSAVVEEPFHIDSEGTDEHFLHDHGECIKAQKKAKALEMENFRKLFGLDNSNQLSPPYKTKPESPRKFLQMEEVPERWFKDTSEWNKNDVASDDSFCASPISPPRYSLSCLELKGTP